MGSPPRVPATASPGLTVGRSALLTLVSASSRASAGACPRRAGHSPPSCTCSCCLRRSADLCHHVGYRNFENTATNIRSVALLTGGEGLHNNHHGYPRSPKFSFRAREFDPAWPIIKVLHLASASPSRTRPSKKSRPNSSTAAWRRAPILDPSGFGRARTSLKSAILTLSFSVVRCHRPSALSRRREVHAGPPGRHSVSGLSASMHRLPVFDERRARRRVNLDPRQRIAERAPRHE